ncbi:MAG: membrane protein insertase YidC [candidate division Zixibacteria bacterium]|nr:membrane protein insertase YidC [candidate division Zixibacteria bacterium]
MDRKTIILVILLGVLVIFWFPIMSYLGLAPTAPTPDPSGQTPANQAQGEPTGIGSDAQFGENERATSPAKQITANTTTTPVQSSLDASLGKTTLDGSAPVDPPETVWVETNTYRVALSTHGGGPVSLKLASYNYAFGEKEMIEMIPGATAPEPRAVLAGGMLDLSELVYTCERTGSTIDARSNPQSVSFVYTDSVGAEIRKTYIFSPDLHSFDLVIDIPDRRHFGIERKYNLSWATEMHATGLDENSDYTSSMIMALLPQGPTIFGSEGILFFGGDWEGDHFNSKVSADVTWLGKRTKYFANVMIPRNKHGEEVFASGKKSQIKGHDGNPISKRVLKMGMTLPVLESPNLSDTFTIYSGPMDWRAMSDYGVELQQIFDIGTTPVVGWLIRIFAIPIMWLLPVLYSIIPNYGFVIILFGILIKVITWPLSRKQVKSMAAMRDLQPRIEKLKEKHKNNPQAMQKAQMKLFKEAGVNPLASCLPLLPQMPLFFALFSVFNSTILLRGAPFILWWDDLSRGAQGIGDPYIILVLVMVVLMFLQQKISMTDPRNKAMMYIMPLVFGFMFFRFSAGLVLYWSTFSAFSFAEQLWGNKMRARKNAQVS